MNSQYQQGGNKNLSRLELAVYCLGLMIQQKIFNYKNHEVGLKEAPDGKKLYIQDLSIPDLDFFRNLIMLHNKQVEILFDALDKAKIFILTAGCGQTDYSEIQITKLINMIEKVDVKINFIALDFMNDYNGDIDDPDKSEEFEALNNGMLTASYQCQEQFINSRYVFLMVQELRYNMRIFPANVAFELYSQFQTRSLQKTEQNFQLMMKYLSKYSYINDFSKRDYRILRNTLLLVNFKQLFIRIMLEMILSIIIQKILI
ncbi:unnamed protein product [Paramecium pentaurelia]|uniref:Uncharacterized protein n=1 Tax=Paramecium pentaurelia TaxID=43138 RepID=A0A8S1XW81_9CILI|nr:unnamed protein product [Paramecium pentaurelia]